MVLGVDADADGRAEQPLVRQRLGPEGIHFETRRMLGLILCGRVQGGLTDAPELL